MVCHHGAGASGLSFAALAREVRDSSRGELGVLAFDARGHGMSRLLLPQIHPEEKIEGERERERERVIENV